MKNRNVLGLILVVLGAILLLQAFNIIQEDWIFFPGWWTLFLIIPAIVSMSRTGVTIGNAILLVVGVGFLLQLQGLSLHGFLVPSIFIVIGVGILLKK